MKFDSRTYEQLLAGQPDCFGVPHASAFNPLMCEACGVRRSCLEVSAQLLLAKRVGLLSGKTTAEARYSRDDELRIDRYVMANVEHRSAVFPCNQAALPKLYDRAMLAYNSREPEPSADELMAELDWLHPVSESSEVAATSAVIDKAPKSIPPFLCPEASSNMSLHADGGPILRGADSVVQLEVVASEAMTAIDHGSGLRLGPVLAAPTTSLSAYAFPTSDNRRYAHYANGALVNEIQRLIERSGLETSTKHYDSVRAEICAIHIEMNLRQQHAPRFRPQSKLRKTPDSRDDENLGCDRQVIDLHWRANSSDKPMSTVIGYERIFDAEQFDFELASTFAQLDWRPHTKVIQLHLTEDMQWEHAIIQAPSIRDKWRTIERGDVRGSEIKQAGAPHIRTCLHQTMANAPHLREHIPGLVRVWMARRIVGDMPKRVARLVALMTGEKVRDVSAIRRAMDSLETRLANARVLRK